MTRLADLEQVLAGQAAVWLSTMSRLGYQSHDFGLHKKIADVHSDVYGRESGEESTAEAGKFEGILIGDTFAPSDEASSGTLQEGWLLTSDKRPQVGDLVEVIRKDGSGGRRYTIISDHSIGMTTRVICKFRVSSVGD